MSEDIISYILHLHGQSCEDFPVRSTRLVACKLTSVFSLFLCHQNGPISPISQLDVWPLSRTRRLSHWEQANFRRTDQTSIIFPQLKPVKPHALQIGLVSSMTKCLRDGGLCKSTKQTNLTYLWLISKRPQISQWDLTVYLVLWCFRSLLSAWLH